MLPHTTTCESSAGNATARYPLRAALMHQLTAPDFLGPLSLKSVSGLSRNSDVLTVTDLNHHLSRGSKSD